MFYTISGLCTLLAKSLNMIDFFTLIRKKSRHNSSATLYTGTRAFICTILISLIANSSVAAEPNTQEQNLRGAVIAGLLRFTLWPETNKKQSRNICLAGSPISSKPIRSNAKSKLINNVFELSGEKPAKTLIDEPCHVVIFGSKLDVISMRLLTDAAVNKRWLTICDGCNDDNSKSMVILKKSGRRIAFDINLKEAQKSQISFSSSLLELASKVRR